jgi:2-methylcitrate dehydratase PrpD
MSDATAADPGQQSRKGDETYSAALASFIHGLRYEDIPEDVRARAKYLILDSVGIAMASNHYDFSDRIFAGIRAMADGGEGTVIGKSERLPLRDAILMNGALVHGLDFDDTHMNAVVHATAVSFPSAMNIAEKLKVSGADLLTAYIAGMEVAIRVGEAANFGFHHNGYHATGVVGHFSAVLLAGKLLGLDIAQLTAAQGMAGSTAMASLEFVEDGAWNKRLHPGWAGVAGYTAASIAKAGFVAPGKPYEGRYGVFKMHLGEHEAEVRYDDIVARLGERWAVTETAIKPYPTCHFTHAIADSALALRAQHNINADEIIRIRALIPEEVIPVIAEPIANKKRPSSDYDAKFSTQFIAAACFQRGKFGLAELEADVLRDPAILALADKVECETDAKSEFPRYYSGGMVVSTRDGGEFVHHERINRGAGDRALSGEEIEVKFMDNALLVTSREQAEAVRNSVLSLDEQDAAGFARSLAPR